ncbi:hypothetical protein O3G_MSEX003793 [Manduca sexta]|uniref:Cyclin N-terminal domain-containing protein n=2 Tax=Manduca sexta TaxID=7130 RepID=A0A921YTF1_MANSE|nr:hypothetical protein O3G_MSEX003793 [Manduca sexta]KAG6445215.1 hypothetical protein O3G_MSEX003793 [Manduca sexta]
MHRFYAFHSFTHFHRNAVAAAALFLAAKVEEQPRKLEYVIKVAHVCLHRGEGASALTAEQYQEQAQDLVFNENVLLQTLGFDVAIDHPHTHVVRTCHLVKAPKDLAQTSYFMASNSLHLTTMCLQYRPTVVACFCIHLASKWSNWAIPQSNEGRHWFYYVDRTVTMDLLEKLTGEFLLIFEKCPSRLKRKMMNVKAADGSSPASVPHPSGSNAVASSPFDKKHAPNTSDEIDKSFDKEYERERRRQPAPGGYVPATTSAPPNQPQPQKIDFNLYREKRDREERERREERARREQMQQQRPGVPQQRPSQPPPHHQRPNQHHHKSHHPWPPHKSHHQKPPHDHRHHRPMPGPSTSSTSSTSVPHQEIPQRTRPPSLFSPENATTPSAAAAAAPRRPQPPPQPQPQSLPQQPPPQAQPQPQPQPQPQHSRPKPEARPNPPPIQSTQEQRPPSPRKRPDPTTAIREMQPPAILSPFSSPPAVEQPKQRVRQQSNSEPELIPVVKKLDETPGYENVIKDSQRGVKTKVPERKPEQVARALNGIETDPTLVSNLLKESLAKPAPITVPTERKSPVEIKKEVIEPPAPPAPVAPPPELPQPVDIQGDHKHKKDKKKKEKHKHKDRDKSKEDRKKHKKDKDKEKKKESPPTETQDGTLRITIPREKLSATSPGLKIKIPKERLAAPPQTSGLKIKIPKEVLETSRKRAAAPEPGPAHKLARHNGAPHKVVESAMGNGHAGK